MTMTKKIFLKNMLNNPSTTHRTHYCHTKTNTSVFQEDTMLLRE